MKIWHSEEWTIIQVLKFYRETDACGTTVVREVTPPQSMFPSYTDSGH